jgi:hypothetical protein
MISNENANYYASCNNGYYQANGLSESTVEFHCDLYGHDSRSATVP